MKHKNIFPITRFAPSPTGYLHLGHVAAALFARQKATSEGHFLLRLEDIDLQRCRPEFCSAIEEDLQWLGFTWEKPVWKQSERISEYRQTLDTLTARGLTYRCFCSRSDIAREIADSAHAPHQSPDGGHVYPGTCRHLSSREITQKLAEGRPWVTRLNMAAALSDITSHLTWREDDLTTVPCLPESFGDIVLARRDIAASYHLCVTHDDAKQGVTCVTRGDDLRAATAVHRLLQTVMSWPEPTYAFHPLLRDEHGRRLAKRDGAQSIRQMRACGLSASDILLQAKEAMDKAVGPS
ncbi:MAG: tRNA glutamyl-Q(34) synthetase GluQRS [Acetobacter sp.]|jgi:glutamyl-Q tRNA(Asp) synthetase